MVVTRTLPKLANYPVAEIFPHPRNYNCRLNHYSFLFYINFAVTNIKTFGFLFHLVKTKSVNNFTFVDLNTNATVENSKLKQTSYKGQEVKQIYSSP